MERRVNVFFYGSYMNFECLAEVDIGERPYDVAHVPGYRLEIEPLANLIPAPESHAYGILTSLTHKELERLYGAHAQGQLGEKYLPEAVIVFTEEEDVVPAMCFICHDMKPGEADPDYVNRLVTPALENGFPMDYIKHIESYKPKVS